jgi:hypothetical protein
MRRMAPMAEPVGGVRLVGRTYLECGRPVVILTAWPSSARTSTAIRFACSTAPRRTLRAVLTRAELLHSGGEQRLQMLNVSIVEVLARSQ